MRVVGKEFESLPSELETFLNPLNANTTEQSNTLKQFELFECFTNLGGWRLNG